MSRTDALPGHSRDFRRYERIPDGILGRPILNPNISSSILNQYGLSLDNLVERSLYFARGKTEEPEDYRASAVRFGVHGRAELNLMPMKPIVVDHAPYLQITVKGSGLNEGDKFGGTFELRDAIKDMDVSEYLTRQGFNTSRVLAIIPFDRQAMEDWHDGTYSEVKKRPRLFGGRRSRRDNDTNSFSSCLIVRLTNPRMSDLQAAEYRYIPRASIQSRDNLRVQFLDLLKAEIGAVGGARRFIDRLEIQPGNIGDNLIPLIQRVAETRDGIGWEDLFSESETEQFIYRFIGYRWGFQAQKIARLIEAGRFPYSYSGPTHNQDVSINGSWNDFEFATHEDPEKNISGRLAEFFEALRFRRHYFKDQMDYFNAGLGRYSTMM